MCRFDQAYLHLQVISGLHELHCAGLWHGQLSPETVLLHSQSQPWLAGACVLPSDLHEEQSLAELTARWHQWQVLWNESFKTLLANFEQALQRTFVAGLTTGQQDSSHWYHAYDHGFCLCCRSATLTTSCSSITWLDDGRATQPFIPSFHGSLTCLCRQRQACTALSRSCTAPCPFHAYIRA